MLRDSKSRLARVVVLLAITAMVPIAQAIAARVCGMGFICDPGVACAAATGTCPNTLPYVSVITSPANVRSCEKSTSGTCNNTVPQTCTATFYYSGAGCTGDINCFSSGTPFNGCDDNS